MEGFFLASTTTQTSRCSDDGDAVELRIHGLDDSLSVNVRGHLTDNPPSSSLFTSLEEGSNFFKHGSLGYSDTTSGTHLDGVQLFTKDWEVRPLSVELAGSSYFTDLKKFPEGSVEFDCALIMRNIEHEWHSAAEMQTGQLASLFAKASVENA